MFTLELLDRNGVSLKEGDIVKVSNGKEFHFFAEVKYLEKENAIAPFHTFSFHSFEKIDKLPDNAIKSTETRYGIWYVTDPENDCAEAAESAKDYLISWRECEHALDKRCFKITRSENNEQPV
jgi:hypothetical protein